MIPFFDACEAVLDRVEPVCDTVETLSLSEALGRVLAQPAVAPFDVPNHDNAAMDGYGVRFPDLNPDSDSTTSLRVTADLPAGDRLDRSLGAGEAVRIMTGAPAPDGCDCVVMQEVVTLERNGEIVMIPPGQKYRQHLRCAGEDIQKGAEVLPQGRRLSPADLGLLASLGYGEVPVFRRLKVALLSTGNEVVDVESSREIQPGQLYDSNRVTLRAALQALHVEVLDLGVVGDRREKIQEAIQSGASEADALITSGGVSVGDFDLVKDVIRDLGQITFWKVAMKPGKPQAYGKIGEAAFFGLPGNPVSSLVVYLLIVQPALFRMMGSRPEPPRRVTLPFRGEHFKRHKRRDFLRAIVHFDDGKGEGRGAWVETTGPQGSGILSSMSRANALIELPEKPMEIREGDRVSVILMHGASDA